MIKSEYQRMAQVSLTHWWYLGKRALLTETISRFIEHRNKKASTSQPKLKILDLGCGTGSNWSTLRRFGWVMGVEQSPLAVKYCRQLGWTSVWPGQIQDFPFPAAKFDLVTILDVLYHQKIDNDVAVLKKAYHTLKPGGWLIVTDCIGPQFYGPHDRNNLARQRYTLPELENKIAVAGFQIQHASHFYFTTWPAFLLTRLTEKILSHNTAAIEDLPPHWTNSFLSHLMINEAKIATQIKLPWGSSGLIVAFKPKTKSAKITAI